MEVPSAEALMRAAHKEAPGFSSGPPGAAQGLAIRPAPAAYRPPPCLPRRTGAAAAAEARMSHDAAAAAWRGTAGDADGEACKPPPLTATNRYVVTHCQNNLMCCGALSAAHEAMRLQAERCSLSRWPDIGL